MKDAVSFYWKDNMSYKLVLPSMETVCSFISDICVITLHSPHFLLSIRIVLHL